MIETYSINNVSDPFIKIVLRFILLRSGTESVVRSNKIIGNTMRNLKRMFMVTYLGYSDICSLSVH